MLVKELILLLQAGDPNAVVVSPRPYGYNDVKGVEITPLRRTSWSPDGLNGKYDKDLHGAPYGKLQKIAKGDVPPNTILSAVIIN